MTKNDYYKLVGLLALADRHYDRLLELEQAVADLLHLAGEPTNYEHLSDMMWGSGAHNDADALLRRLGVVVHDGNVIAEEPGR